MYAIVQVGGRQYRAAVGGRLVVDRLDVEPGARLRLPDVRMLVAEPGDAGETLVGRPRLEEVSVAARAVAQLRGPKVLVFKYKPKKRYRRHRGFRAELTELRVEEVRVGAYEEEPEPKPAAPRRRRSGAKPAATAAAAAPPETGPETAPEVTAEVHPASSTAEPAPAAEVPKPRVRRRPAAADSETPGPPPAPGRARKRAEKPDGS